MKVMTVDSDDCIDQQVLKEKEENFVSEGFPPKLCQAFDSIIPVDDNDDDNDDDDYGGDI